MAKRTVSAPKAVGRRGIMKNMVNRAGGQTRMRRELAAQRKALGAAGQERAMRNWGLSERKAKFGAKGAVRGIKISGGKRG